MEFCIILKDKSDSKNLIGLELFPENDDPFKITSEQKKYNYTDYSEVAYDEISKSGEKAVEAVKEKVKNARVCFVSGQDEETGAVFLAYSDYDSTYVEANDTDDFVCKAEIGTDEWMKEAEEALECEEIDW